jgi:hypothetical protein
MRLTVRCVSRLFIPSVSLVRFQAHHLPRAWAYRGRSLGKDWRFPVKRSERGPDKPKRSVRPWRAPLPGSARRAFRGEGEARSGLERLRGDFAARALEGGFVSSAVSRRAV